MKWARFSPTDSEGMSNNSVGNISIYVSRNTLYVSRQAASQFVLQFPAHLFLFGGRWVTLTVIGVSEYMQNISRSESFGKFVLIVKDTYITQKPI